MSSAYYTLGQRLALSGVMSKHANFMESYAETVGDYDPANFNRLYHPPLSHLFMSPWEQFADNMKGSLSGLTGAMLSSLLGIGGGLGLGALANKAFRFHGPKIKVLSKGSKPKILRPTYKPSDKVSLMPAYVGAIIGLPLGSHAGWQLYENS